jgi:hypothetical protein
MTFPAIEVNSVDAGIICEIETGGDNSTGVQAITYSQVRNSLSAMQPYNVDKIYLYSENSNQVSNNIIYRKLNGFSGDADITNLINVIDPMSPNNATIIDAPITLNGNSYVQTNLLPETNFQLKFLVKQKPVEQIILNQNLKDIQVITQSNFFTNPLNLRADQEDVFELEREYLQDEERSSLILAKASPPPLIFSDFEPNTKFNADGNTKSIDKPIKNVNFVPNKNDNILPTFVAIAAGAALAFYLFKNKK